MTHLTLAQLSASLDEQLGGTTGDAVRRHLGICPDCRAWRDRLAKDGERLRELLACEPEEDLFDELFDGIEAAIRNDAIAEQGPRAVTMKRNLLGLVRGRDASRQGDRPASGAMPRPAAAKPPVLPSAGADPELEERGKPDAAGFIKPPPPVFPTEVKPSSAELVRPSPPRFAPPPAEGPRSGALSEPFTPPATPRAADIVPTVPAPPARTVAPVEKAPAWHHEATPPERRPFEPIVGPRPDTPVPAPRPAEVSERGTARASAEMRRPAHRPDEDVVPRSRVTRLEWMVAGGVLLAALALTVAVWQWQHARNVERARRMLQPPASAPARAVPGESTAPARDDRKSAATTAAPRGAGATPARDARAMRVRAASLDSRVPERVVRENPTRDRAPDATPRERASVGSASPPAARIGDARAARAREPERAPGTGSSESRPRAASDDAANRRPAPTTPPTAAKPAESPTPAPVAPVPTPSRTSESASSDDSASWPLLCGQVFDEQGEPVAGARVLLADLDLGARTDRRGRFCISAPPGDRTLSVIALGFKTHRQGLTLTAASPELRVVLASAQ